MSCRWHYYLLDFCYFANALMLAHLWLLPHSALLHKARALWNPPHPSVGASECIRSQGLSNAHRGGTDAAGWCCSSRSRGQDPDASGLRSPARRKAKEIPVQKRGAVKGNLCKVQS